MPLITVDDYLDRFYATEMKPCKRTIYRWIKTGQLAAEKRGKRFFINTDKIEQRTGNDIADKILNE